MDASLTVTYGPRPRIEPEPRNLLKLEQQEWKQYTGVLTRLGVVRYLQEVLYGKEFGGELLDCGLADGHTMLTAIYAWPLVPDLAYTLHTSYGSLGPRLVENLELDEILTVSLDDTVRPEYPASEIHSVEWLGDCFDAANQKTSHPAVTTDGEDIHLSRQVYGSLRVKYTAVRHVYMLSVIPRATAIEDLFGAVVYGLYQGGITWLEVSAPPNADELARGVPCGGLARIDPDDPDDPYEPRESGGDREREINMCTGVVLSDSHAE